ncbi:MAG TPA: tetratricopeptide repeat protein [Pyrinomonadaceae bacterium]|nr:tetratricopeptide repeat protein [Pyrinomonadaceae bacterium]
MGFDRAKAMRNAERFVAQGKIRAAIDEYRSVVDNDPRDIATLNMLGDLYAKDLNKQEAIRCYMQVADHYGNQGFSQKAIAVYNKISRIQPDSVEVTAKLAELHKAKGSLSDARSHYQMLAEHYQKAGKRLEALAMYKQIAMLDPNNTEVCMNLADSYVRENQMDEALEAFAEAGSRFSRQGRNEEAVRALMKGFDIKSNDLRILNGLVRAQAALGRAQKAASLLEDILHEEPYNRDVLYLLIECCLEAQNTVGAERAIIKLVEIEPANYPRFVDLIRMYLNVNDAESAGRILTMSAEYLLAGGQSEECGKWINEILEREPNQLAGLRLLVRYNSWLNDENGIRLALERLYAAAAAQASVEDEHFALKQLVVLRPHEVRYRDRLNEINEQYDFGEAEPIADTVDEGEGSTPVEAETTAAISEDLIERNGHHVDAQIMEAAVEATASSNGHHAPELSHGDAEKLQKELDSIAFYIENDYYELADRSLDELSDTYGEQPGITELRKRMGKEPPEHAEIIHEVDESQVEVTASSFGIDEIRSEFGLEGGEEASSGDYDTHYQMGVAYQEMALMEDAIREYQDAVNLAGEGTRKFFQCATLLGHCFMANGTPHHAITWLERALEVPDLTDEEQHGVWYELALAHDANEDDEKAAEFFEKIYAENVDFRDVSNRVREHVGSH